MPDITVKVPQNLPFTKASVQSHVLTSASQAQLANTIAPTLEHIVAAAGIKLSAEQATELNQAFAERGVVTIRPGGANMSATVSVEATSLNYTSKTLAGAIHE